MMEPETMASGTVPSGAMLLVVGADPLCTCLRTVSLGVQAFVTTRDERDTTSSSSDLTLGTFSPFRRVGDRATA